MKKPNTPKNSVGPTASAAAQVDAGFAYSRTFFEDLVDSAAPVAGVQQVQLRDSQGLGQHHGDGHKNQ